MKKLLTLLLLSPLAFAEDDISHKPTTEIWPEYIVNGNNSLRVNCSQRNASKFKRWWTPQIEGNLFQQNNNTDNWLHLKKEGASCLFILEFI